MTMNKGDAHREYLVSKIAQRIDAKYKEGQARHGGALERKPCLQHAIEEALDLPVYLLTLEDQWDEALEHLSQALRIIDNVSHLQDDFLRGHILSALNIISMGNADGGVEEELDP